METNYPIIEITWTDAQTLDGWNDRDDKLPDDCTCTTVGYLIHETDKFITVAQSMSPDEYGNIWQIPKKMVDNIKKWYN